MSNTTDQGAAGRRADAVGETLRAQGRTALEEARKPLLAILGVGEAAATALRAQFKDLPGATQGGARLLSARASQVQEQLRHLDTTALREAVAAHVAQARSVYEELAARGEHVVTRTRNHPQVQSALDGLGLADVLGTSTDETHDTDGSPGTPGTTDTAGAADTTGAAEAADATAATDPAPTPKAGTAKRRTRAGGDTAEAATPDKGSTTGSTTHRRRPTRGAGGTTAN